MNMTDWNKAARLAKEARAIHFRRPGIRTDQIASEFEVDDYPSEDFEVSDSDNNMANREARLAELYLIKSKALACGDIQTSDLISAVIESENLVLSLWDRFGVDSVRVSGDLRFGTFAINTNRVA